MPALFLESALTLAGANTFEVGNAVSQYSVSTSGAVSLQGLTGDVTLGGSQGGLLYEVGFELSQTIDLALAYLTFGLGGGIDGLTGGGPDSYGLPLAGVFPLRVQLMFGEVGFFNLYGEAKVAWVTGERGTAVGIKDLERLHVNEASLELGIRFSGGLDLAVRRRMLGSATFDTVALRFSWL